MNTFIYLYDELSFSSDLIAYLVEYCVSKNHTAIRYIEATALKWAESGIRTVTAAKQEAKIHSPAYYAVMRSFGITGRNLVPSETDYIEKMAFRIWFFDRYHLCGMSADHPEHPPAEFSLH